MAVYGIDLGTTYSCISKFENNDTSVITNEFDEKSTASAVYFGKNNQVIVGDDAKCYVQTEGHRVIQFIKREIGKEAFPHEIDGKEYNAIEVSSIILKKLVKIAQEKGENVKDVVITCPAYFGNEERNATIAAGKLAGLNVLELINEPTAAAISYAFSTNNLKSETVVVYDLGGGTFDVTVLDIEVGSNGIPSCKVLASDGDDLLGGKDWDNELYEVIKNKLMEENGLDEIEIEDCNNILSIVEKTKKSLTNREFAKIRVLINGENMTCEVSREDFETATAYLVQRTTDCLDRILSSKNVSEYKINKILLVGGSTNMPMIQRTLKTKYGESGAMNKFASLSLDPYVDPIPVVFADPETAVAKGAAIFANMLKNAHRSGEQIEIHDIASRTFGIDCWFGDLDSGYNGLSNITFKDEEIPVTREETYYTMNDNQKRVSIDVFESIIKDPNLHPRLDKDEDGQYKNFDLEYGIKYLGHLDLPVPPNSPAGSPIYVTICVSAGGIKIIARNSRNESREVEIEFSNSKVDYKNNNVNALSIE